MPNHASAAKNLRHSIHRNAINRANHSRIRTFIRKVEDAVQQGNAELARESLKAAQPEIHRGVTKGLWHRNKAARKISRLHARVRAMAGS